MTLRYADSSAEPEMLRGLGREDTACPGVPPCTGLDVINHANFVILLASCFITTQKLHLRMAFGLSNCSLDANETHCISDLCPRIYLR
jgi:hypothetical protein